MEPSQTTNASAAPAVAPAASGFKVPAIVKVIGIFLGVVLLIAFFLRMLRGVGGGALGAITGGGSGAARKKKMAEVREGRSIARAEKREDRQDRKDLREQIKALKRERRNCKKATKSIRRKGGKRRAAKAACNKMFQEEVKKLREDFKNQEASSDARLDAAFETDEQKSQNSGMGADGDD